MEVRKKSLKIVSVFIISICLFLVAGCATMGTVWRQVDKPEFQAENQPIRELRIAVYGDESRLDDKEGIEKTLADASYELERQVGIRLKIVSFQPIIWEGKSRSKRLNKLWGVANEDHHNFDIAIAVGRHTIGDVMKMLLLGTWEAVIDDTYRRYVVTKVLSDYVLIHEICHAFIFSHTHGEGGLMQGIQMKLLPGIPALNKTVFLSPEDRKEILKNKWRDFNEKPPISINDKEDPLAEAEAELKTNSGLNSQILSPIFH